MAADDGGEDEDAPLGPPPDPSLRSWRHPSEIASANAAAARDLETHPGRRTGSGRRSLMLVAGCAFGVFGVLVLGAALARPAIELHATESSVDESRAATPPGNAAITLGDRTPMASATTGIADATAPPGDPTDTDVGGALTTTTIAHATAPSTLPATLEPGASGVVSLLDPASQDIVATGVILDGQVLSSSGALQGRGRVLIATINGPIEGIVEGADPFSDLAVISVLDPDLLPASVRIADSEPTIGSKNRSEALPGDAVWLVAAGGQPTPIAVGGELSKVGEPAMATNGEMLFDTLHTTIRVPTHGAGGALIDSEGRTIGMVVSCGRQLAVALPIDVLRSSAASIRETGWGHVGWLGIEGSLAEDGITLHQVDADGPAAVAGLEVGDRLEAVDGTPLQHLSQLVHATRNAGVGNTIEVVVIRDDLPFSAFIIVGTRVG